MNYVKELPDIRKRLVLSNKTCLFLRYNTRSLSSLPARVFASILLSTFKRDIGLYEPQSVGSLSFLRIKDIVASVRLGGRRPFNRDSLYMLSRRGASFALKAL